MFSRGLTLFWLVFVFVLFCLLKSKISGCWLLKLLVLFFELSLIDKEANMSSGLILLLLLFVIWFVLPFLFVDEEVNSKISILLELFVVWELFVFVSFFFGLK